MQIFKIALLIKLKIGKKSFKGKNQPNPKKDGEEGDLGVLGPPPPMDSWIEGGRLPCEDECLWWWTFRGFCSWCTKSSSISGGGGAWACSLLCSTEGKRACMDFEDEALKKSSCVKKHAKKQTHIQKNWEIEGIVTFSSLRICSGLRWGHGTGRDSSSCCSTLSRCSRCSRSCLNGFFLRLWRFPF